MPTNRHPTYRLHKPTGQAVVTLNGKDFYLGRHGTKESNVIPQDAEEVRREQLEMLRKRNLDHFFEMRDIEKSITKVGTDARLTETTRQRCADLWKTFESLRNDYVAPFDTLDEYSARCRRNQIALEGLSGSLRVILGVD